MDAAHEVVDFGLHLILSDQDMSPFSPEGAAFFFMKFFVSAFSSAGDAEKKKLRGTLLSGPKEPSGLAPLMFEFVVAAMFSIRGNEVERLEQEGRPDFSVSSGLVRMAVECKCVSSASKGPIPMPTRDVLTKISAPLLNTEKQLTDQLLIRAAYTSDDFGKSGPAISKLDALLKQVAMQPGQWRNSHWAISIESLPKEYRGSSIEEVAPAVQARVKAAQGKIHVVSVTPGVGAIEIEGSREWRADKALDEAMSYAFKYQLNLPGLRMLWIQVLGSTALFMGSENPNVLGAIFTHNVNIRNRLKRLSDSKDGFAGVNVCGDYFIADEGEGVARLGFSVNFVPSAHRPDVYMYALCFMRVTPEQMDKSTFNFDKGYFETGLL
jgi:hypothetical protein